MLLRQRFDSGLVCYPHYFPFKLRDPDVGAPAGCGGQLQDRKIIYLDRIDLEWLARIDHCASVPGEIMIFGTSLASADDAGRPGCGPALYPRSLLEPSPGADRACGQAGMTRDGGRGVVSVVFMIIDQAWQASVFYMNNSPFTHEVVIGAPGCCRWRSGTHPSALRQGGPGVTRRGHESTCILRGICRRHTCTLRVGCLHIAMTLRVKNPLLTFCVPWLDVSAERLFELAFCSEIYFIIMSF